MQLFNQLVSGSPNKPQKNVCRHAALDTAPCHRTVAKHYQQHDADTKKESYDQKTTTEPLEKWCRMRQ